MRAINMLLKTSSKHDEDPDLYTPSYLTGGGLLVAGAGSAYGAHKIGKKIEPLEKDLEAKRMSLESIDESDISKIKNLIGESKEIEKSIKDYKFNKNSLNLLGGISALAGLGLIGNAYYNKRQAKKDY